MLAIPRRSAWPARRRTIRDDALRTPRRGPRAGPARQLRSQHSATTSRSHAAETATTRPHDFTEPPGEFGVLRASRTRRLHLCKEFEPPSAPAGGGSSPGAAEPLVPKFRSPEGQSPVRVRSPRLPSQRVPSGCGLGCPYAGGAKPAAGDVGSADAPRAPLQHPSPPDRVRAATTDHGQTIHVPPPKADSTQLTDERFVAGATVSFRDLRTTKAVVSFGAIA